MRAHQNFAPSWKQASRILPLCVICVGAWSTMSAQSLDFKQISLAAGPMVRDIQGDQVQTRAGVEGRMALVASAPDQRFAVQFSLTAATSLGPVPASTVTTPGQIETPGPIFLPGANPSPPQGAGSFNSVAAAVELRWYAHEQQVGPYIGIGGGPMLIQRWSSASQIQALGVASVGYSREVGNMSRAFVEAHYESVIGADPAPRWFMPVLFGLSLSTGR
jgi:hypothetical protein